MLSCLCPQPGALTLFSCCDADQSSQEEPVTHPTAPPEAVADTVEAAVPLTLEGAAQVQDAPP